VLADWASQHNEDVVVIPSCVSPDSYRQKTDYQVRDPPRLGWIGSPDNEVYLRLVAPALGEVHRKTGARLTLIVTTRPDLGSLETFIDRVPWSEAAQHATLADLDLGLAPLPDEPYTRGKCYKLLQYAAGAHPSVRSASTSKSCRSLACPRPGTRANGLTPSLTCSRSQPERAPVWAAAPGK
jgi:hypothetical protein